MFLEIASTWRELSMGLVCSRVLRSESSIRPTAAPKAPKFRAGPLDEFLAAPATPTPSESAAEHMMPHVANICKVHMMFYPGGGDEWEEDEAVSNFLTTGRPKFCKMQCTSHTERLQLALLDQKHGMDASFLNAKEKSFLDALNEDEKRRMFSLTDEDMESLDETKEGEDIKMPSLPSSSSSAKQKTRPYPLSEPVEMPGEVADIIKDTLSRLFKFQ